MTSGDGGDMPRPLRSRLSLLLLASVAVLLLLALGTWQVRRLAWKRDLIAQVDARLHVPVVPAPGPAEWSGITDATAAYRRVRIAGLYLNDRAVRTQAVTVHGSGSWLLTPLRSDRGFVVLVNRGFVPPGWRAPPSPATSPAIVTGLLRLTEPVGGFLRHNDPAHDRWYSRDVAAISAARRLGPVAPYFIDAAADPAAPFRPPIGGLTVVAFPNNHLVYAVTWYSLAIMVAAGSLVMLRAGRSQRR